MLLEQFNPAFGRDAIGLLIVRSIGRQPGQGTPQPALRIQIGQLVLIILIAPARIDDIVPRLGVIQTIGPDLSRHAVVEYFSNPRHVEAILPIHLRQRERIGKGLGAKIRLKIIDFGRIRPQARHQ